MVLASHIIFSTYGFWLPNDPRGSWSDFVRNWDLFLQGGPARKVSVRHSIAKQPHDRRARQYGKDALRFNLVRFTGTQARSVATGFRKAVAESQYDVLACSIMPDHVHMVVARHENAAERIIGHLKARATQQLVADDLHPFVELRDEHGRFPSVWANSAWKVFLDSQTDIDRAIRYVRDNPLKEGKPLQKWSFVKTV
jgi:REP element-mobilizing transposase RayT